MKTPVYIQFRPDKGRDFKVYRHDQPRDLGFLDAIMAGILGLVLIFVLMGDNLNPSASTAAENGSEGITRVVFVSSEKR